MGAQLPGLKRRTLGHGLEGSISFSGSSLCFLSTVPRARLLCQALGRATLPLTETGVKMNLSLNFQMSALCLRDRKDYKYLSF